MSEVVIRIFNLIAFAVLFTFPSWSSPVRETLQCRYFYGGVDANWLSLSPDWFYPSLLTFKEGLAQKDAQAKFENDVLGLPYRSDINTDEKLGAFLSQFYSKSPLTPAVIYFNGVDYIARTNGEPAPAGFTVYEGVYSDTVYYSFISKGLYPIGDITSEIKYFGFEIPETTAKHGLSHLGGFFENKVYADYIKKLGDYFLNLTDAAQTGTERYKVAFFSESFWFASPAQKESIDGFLDSLSHTVSRKEMGDLTDLLFKLSTLDHQRVIRLARHVLESIPDSTPLGGGTRDYSEKISFTKQMAYAKRDKNKERSPRFMRAYQGYDLLTSLSVRDSVISLDLKKALDINDINEIRIQTAKLLAHAHGLNQLEIGDWYEASTYQKTEGAQRVKNHVCLSGIYHLKQSALARTFCK